MKSFQNFALYLTLFDDSSEDMKMYKLYINNARE